MSALVQTSYANETTPYFALAGGSTVSLAQWSTFPAVSTIDASSNAITNISSLQIDAQVLTANASELFLNGVPIATIPDISNVADWALYPALANIDANNFAISNVSGFELDGNQVSTLGDTILINGLNPVSNWSSYTAGTNVNMGGNGISNVSGFQLDGQAISTDGLFVLVNGSNGVERWSQFGAVGNVNLSGHDIINVDQIDASGVSAVDTFVNTIYVYETTNNSAILLTTDPSATQLLVNGSPVYTGASPPPSDVSLWANYPAVADVNMSGKNILGNGDLGISANNISMSALSNIYINQNATTKSIAMTGNITQCNAGAGSNFFQSEVQVGVNGVLPTDNLGAVAIYGGNVPGLLSSLYVEGGTTLDGGDAIHGITIGTLPVLGVNTQRIDVLPVGIEMTTPTFITMNGLGAANIAMGGAVAIAAGSYVTLEHAAGLGANGIFVQNAADDSNARMIFTSGGTIYNATEVQASNIVNPLGVRFYNGVYNPSGGSIIVPPVYGRAIVDGSASSYLATLTGGDLPATKNTNSVFIGNLPNLTTLGVASTIAIGDLSGMARQSEFSIAIGFRAGLSGQQTAGIAIGASAGSNNQGGDGIAIGAAAGSNNQRGQSVAIGVAAGSTTLGSNSVAIGAAAGSNTLGSNSVAIGAGAGQTGSGTSCVAIGYNAGSNNLGSNSIAIGALSATGGMGEFSTYIGTANTVEGAVQTKTIVLNNTGLAMNPANNNAFYVGTVRSVASSAGFNMVAHNNGTGEFIQTLTSSLSMDDTISNTQRISYDTGLLTTQIDGLLKVNGGAEFTQSITANTTLNVLGLTTLSSLVIQNISAGLSAKSVYYNPSLGVLTQADAPTAPAFVYYVSTNGRVGGSGSITDPLSTINEALTKPASTAPDKPGMTIYVAPGEYFEDVAITLTLTLPAVAIIGMGDDTDDSKRVQIRGSVSVNASFVGAINTVNVVMLNSIAIFAKDASTSAVTITGAGVRTYLKNGLYTTPFVTAAPLIAISSTGATSNTINQLVIDNASLSIGAATATAHIINVASGQIFQILFSDLTNLGTGLCINMAGGAFSEATQSRFNARTAVLNIVCSAASLTSLTQCLVSGRASTSVALITLGTNANLNANDNTIQNLNTTEANNTSRYIYTTSATGNLIAAIRNNITNSASPATVQQITPFQAAVPAASQLLYFGNIYTNSTATLVGVLPQQGGANFNAVRQFNTDTYTQQIQVVATSASAIVLTPTARGKTFILTGTTTQAFSTTGFGLADAGFFVIAHNGNASGGGDINLTGMTGTAIIHNRTALQNGGIVYLYWTGAGLVGY
jgi:hypothetical protein